MAFRNPDPDVIRSLLERARTIAVVGYSPHTHRASNSIARTMQARGYRVVPVRPGLDAALGERAWPAIRALPDDVASSIDIVDVFRSPEHVPAIVDECIERRMPVLWLQDGVVNVPAAERAVAAGITVIMDRCIARDHRMLGVGRLAPAGPASSP